VDKKGLNLAFFTISLFMHNVFTVYQLRNTFSKEAISVVMSVLAPRSSAIFLQA
jgi:hypothetical protein